MDDTAIFATSRDMMKMKLNKLKECADDIGMLLHPSKCQYLTVNSSDSVPFVLDYAVIAKTISYHYLGAHISNDTVTNQVKQHINGKAAHVLKFVSFLSKNNDCPYVVKHKVRSSALNAAILYSSETWLTNDLRAAEKPYISTLKQMLSGRQITCNDLVFLETGVPNAKSLIIDRQIKFLRKLRMQHSNDYITAVIALAIRVKSPMGKRIQYLEHETPSQSTSFLANLRSSIPQSDSSRRKTYVNLNPNLSVSSVLKGPSVQEHHRIALTRIRLGSHHLRVETGRWARIPPENRLCQCGTGVQTEEHVMLHCPTSKQLREQFGMHMNTLPELFELNEEMISNYCYHILKLYRT